MKKRVYLMVLACLAVVGLSAQDLTFSKGDQVVNATVGLGNSIYGSGFTGGIPPVSVSFEYGVKDDLFNEKTSLGIGGIVGYTSATQDYTFAKYNFTSFIIGARGAVHYALVDNLDTYAGVLLGYNVASAKTTTDIGFGGFVIPAVGGVAYGGFVGARYYFTPSMAALGELGYGIAWLNVGLSFKL